MSEKKLLYVGCGLVAVLFGVIYSINYVWGVFLGVAVMTLLGRRDDGRCRDWLFFLLCYIYFILYISGLSRSMTRSIV